MRIEERSTRRMGDDRWINAAHVVECWADSRIQSQWPLLTGSCALSCVKALKVYRPGTLALTCVGNAANGG